MKLIENTNVKITVLDINGNEIKTLISGFHKPGKHACTFTPGKCPDGSYLYKMTTDYSSCTRLMVKK